jgi:ABC-type nitrate/sulfonate/bicarbonate transport system permease component
VAAPALSPARTAAPAGAARRPRAGGGRLRTFLLRWVVLLAFLTVWHLLTLRLDSPFFPSPVEILGRVRQTWLSGPASSLFLTERVAADIVPSLARLLAGWSIAVLAGIGVGTAVGLSRRLGDYVDPLVSFARAIPPPALIPLFLVLLGVGSTMKVALIAFGVVWPILLNTIDGVRGVDAVQLDTLRAFRIGGRRRVTRVLLPAAAPRIFAGLRVSLSLSLILMVISEMVAGTGGIGFTILQAQRSFATLNMWAGIVVLSVLGYVLNTLLLAVEARLLAWHRGARSGVDR